MNTPTLTQHDAGSIAPVECRVCFDWFHPVAEETRCPSCDRLADDCDEMHAMADAMVAEANDRDDDPAWRDDLHPSAEFYESGMPAAGRTTAPRPTNPAPRWPRTFVMIASEPTIKRLEEAINHRLGAIEDAGGQVVEVTPYFDGDEGWNAALILYQASEEVS